MVISDINCSMAIYIAAQFYSAALNQILVLLSLLMRFSCSWFIKKQFPQQRKSRRERNVKHSENICTDQYQFSFSKNLVF